MMENLFYSPFDLAVIISSMNFGLQKENELINFIWENEQNFIQPKYRNSKRKFVLNIYYWTNYLNNKADIDLEFPAVKNDLSELKLRKVSISVIFLISICSLKVFESALFLTIKRDM